MKPITWQPSRIQTDSERQWAETVLCFIGVPRYTVYSDGFLFDRWAKMSTSRKLRDKLAKHRRSARKATSREAARKEPEPIPAKSSRPRRRPPPRGEQSPPTLLSQVLNLFAFATGCRAKNYLHISEPMPGLSGTQRQTTPGRGERVRARGSPRRESQHGLVIASHPGRHTVPWRPRWPPKYPRPHQPPEHRTFLPQAVPRCRFLGSPVPPNKPASQAGQAVQARFILRQEF